MEILDKLWKERKLILVVLIVMSLLQFSLAANIGVSPASITFKNVLRGGYAERPVIVTVDSKENVTVTISTRGEISDWLNLSVKSFEVSNNKPFVFKVVVMPPSDIPNGNYSGFIRLKTSGFGKGIEKHAVGIVQSALDLLVTVEVVDYEIRDCKVVSVNLDSIEKGDPLILKTKIKNEGNIRLKPVVKLEIWDELQLQVLKSKDFVGEEVLPDNSKEYVFEMTSRGLDVGQYWANFLVDDCDYSQTLTFDILEEGALRASGVLLKILTKPIAVVGEIVPIVVKFKNDGEKAVKAKFVGQVMKNGKIILPLESEEILVPVNSVGDLNLRFTPKKAGKYLISGRVFYNGKRTFESSASLEVISKESPLKDFVIYALYIFFISAIVFLSYKIRVERRRYKEKIRRFKYGKI